MTKISNQIDPKVDNNCIKVDKNGPKCSKLLKLFLVENSNFLPLFDISKTVAYAAARPKFDGMVNELLT